MKGYILTVKSKYTVSLVHYFTQLWKVTICCEQSFWTLWGFRIRFANTNCFIFSKLMLILHFICCRIVIVVVVPVVPVLVTVPLRLETVTRREETPATSSSCPAPKKMSKLSTEKKSTKIEVRPFNWLFLAQKTLHQLMSIRIIISCHKRKQFKYSNRLVTL